MCGPGTLLVLNAQRQSRMETNRRNFNFLITSRGYHRYSILHKSIQWLLASPQPYSPSLLYSLWLHLPFLHSSVLSFSLLYFPALCTVLFSHSVSFCSAFHHGGRLEEATASLVSSLHCCVAIETRGWRCMLCFFFICFQGEADWVKWQKEEEEEEVIKIESKHDCTVFSKILSFSVHQCWSHLITANSYEVAFSTSGWMQMF